MEWQVSFDNHDNQFSLGLFANSMPTKIYNYYQPREGDSKELKGITVPLEYKSALGSIDLHGVSVMISVVAPV